MKGSGMLGGNFELNPAEGDQSGRGPSRLFKTPKRDHFKTQTNTNTVTFHVQP